MISHLAILNQSILFRLTNQFGNVGFYKAFDIVKCHKIGRKIAKEINNELYHLNIKQSNILFYRFVSKQTIFVPINLKNTK